MQDFCSEQELIISDKLLLPDNSYTYVGHREGVFHYSWLDHIVSSADFHQSIKNMIIRYDVCDEDHLPVSTLININLLPNFTDSNNEHVPRINWDSATDADLKSYLKLTEKKKSELELLMDAFLCSDLNCQHC